ncbi:MAG: hypothetical protein J6N70_10640 [Oribacterium sp.]|nr:hypothetical protein [Oribacterium sp.]
MNVQMILADSARILDTDSSEEDDNGGIVPQKLTSKEDIKNFIQNNL